MIQLSSTAQIAQQFYNTTYAKFVIFTGNSWQVIGETVELIAGENLVQGNVVELSSTTNRTVVKATTTYDEQVIGVVAFENVNSGDYVTIATRAIWPVLCTSGTYTNASYLTVDTVDGVARLTNAVSDQPFAKLIVSTTLPSTSLIDALLHCQEIY